MGLIMEKEMDPGGLAEVSADSTPSRQDRPRRFWWQRLTPFIPSFLKVAFLRFDKRVDGAASFFVKHWGKSRFMVSMSKKAQYLGIENLFLKGPKAFIYFFLFYLVRDTILYILIPIFFAQMTST
jgi:hypothetical protein